ncbi:MAG TPA: DUF1707 domain-containing protein [Kribbella sp.]
MSSEDRDRRRGGPAGRRRRDWQGWNGQGWNRQGGNGQGWNGQRSWGGDWHARGWSGDWRAAAWSDPDDQTRSGSQHDADRNAPWNTGREDAQRDAPSGPGRESARRDRPWDTGSEGGAGRDRGADGEVWQRSDVPGKRVRIGDAERDQAVSLLSDHFVAGRLTQVEFEERSEQATRARYADELEPLFDELPTSMELQPAQAGNLRRRPGPPPAFLMIAPFLMIALVISSVALAAPWLLWGMFWVVMISGISRRRWYHHPH